MTLARLARIAVQTGRLRCEVGAHARRRRRARKQCMMQRPRQVRLSPTMECIFEYPFVRMPSLCPWIAACKYYALQRKTQTERQTRETVGWRAFTRGKCIFPRSDAFTAAPGVGAGVAAAREPGGAGSFRASSTLSPRRPESRSRFVGRRAVVAWVGQNGMHLIYAKN